MILQARESTEKTSSIKYMSEEPKVNDIFELSPKMN